MISSTSSLTYTQCINGLAQLDLIRFQPVGPWRVDPSRDGFEIYSSGDLLQLLIATTFIDGTSSDIGRATGRYEVSAQDVHLARLFKVLEHTGLSWTKNFLHINYLLIQGMSTCKRTAVFLNHIVEEAGNMMHISRCRRTKPSMWLFK